MQHSEEQIAEFCRLSRQFNWPAIENFVLNRHAAHRAIDGSLLLRHLHQVAAMTVPIAQGAFAELDLSEQSYRTNVCRAAAFLHEAVRLGGVSFEGLVVVADTTAARVVAELTPDHRLPEPRRIDMHLNALGCGDEMVQLVALCDLRHETSLRLRKVEQTREPDEEIAYWVAVSKGCLDLLNKPQGRAVRSLQVELAAELQRLETYGPKMRMRR